MKAKNVILFDLRKKHSTSNIKINNIEFDDTKEYALFKNHEDTRKKEFSKIGVVKNLQKQGELILGDVYVFDDSIEKIESFSVTLKALANSVKNKVVNHAKLVSISLVGNPANLGATAFEFSTDEKAKDLSEINVEFATCEDFYNFSKAKEVSDDDKAKILAFDDLKQELETLKLEFSNKGKITKQELDSRGLDTNVLVAFNLYHN